MTLLRRSRIHRVVAGHAGSHQWLKDLYTAMGRPPKGSDADFAKQMREEQRNIVLVTPERL